MPRASDGGGTSGRTDTSYGLGYTPRTVKFSNYQATQAIVKAFTDIKKSQDAQKREVEQTGIKTSSGDTPVDITANQNDYIVGAFAWVRLTTDASRTITGFTGGVEGRELEITNVGSFNLVLAHENASSLAANRIISPTGANITLAPNQTAYMRYDTISNRWRIRFHSGT